MFCVYWVYAHISWTGAGEPPEDGEMNEMTPPSRHRIRNSSPGGLRTSTLPLSHGGSPSHCASDNGIVLWDVWWCYKNLFVRFRFNCLIIIMSCYHDNSNLSYILFKNNAMPLMLIGHIICLLWLNNHMINQIIPYYSYIGAIVLLLTSRLLVLQWEGNQHFSQCKGKQH